MFFEFIAKVQAEHDDNVRKYLARRAKRDADHSKSTKMQVSRDHHKRHMHKPLPVEASKQVSTPPVLTPYNDGSNGVGNNVATNSLDGSYEGLASTPPTHYRTMAWKSMEDDQHQSPSVTKDGSLIIEPPISISPTLGQSFLLEEAVKDFLLDEYNVNSHRNDEENDIMMTRQLCYVPDSNMTRELYCLPE
jgi:hypothetical protein